MLPTWNSYCWQYASQKDCTKRWYSHRVGRTRSWYNLALIQWRGLHSGRGVATRGGRRGWDTAPAGAGGRGRGGRGGGAAHASTTGRAADPVAAHVGGAGRPAHAAERLGAGGGGAAVAGRAGAPADLRVAVRLRQLRRAHRRGQPAAHHGVRCRRPYGWVVRPLILNDVW